jgi:C4-dicarboxylate-specific signal transduction histidine kinase
VHSIEQPPHDEALHLLARATDLLANCTDYEATLEFIANLLVSSLANWCVIDLVNDDGKIDRVAVTHRDAAKATMARKIRSHYPAKPSATRGVYRVIETQQSILIPHTPESMWALRADNEEHLRLIMELGSTSYMCVPLLARGRVVGSIMLFSEERTYREQDLNTAERLAKCIALAVDNVHMFRKMQSTQAQLVQSAKLAALGVISAGIAHEVNNPLAIMRGSLQHFEILAERQGTVSYEQVKTYSEKVFRSIDRIVKIVTHVKDFSRQSAHKFAPVGVRHLIETSLNLFGQQFQHTNIAIHKEFPPDDLRVHGDFTRLEQVIVNILTNAKDAIESKAHGDGGNIWIRLSSPENRIRVEIEDDGEGMSEEFVDRVFEPFFTTKEVGKGTGLGLAISHGIIKDHHGIVQASSTLGRGTRIEFELPLYTL